MFGCEVSMRGVSWPASLLVMPERGSDDTDREIRRIGCGVNGRERSTWALRVAAEAALALDAELDVIRAIVAPSPMIDPGVSEALASRAVDQLRAAMATLPAGLRAHGSLVQDADVATALAARSRELDLLVVGAPRGGPGRASDPTARRMLCPMLVVSHRVPTARSRLLS